MLEIISKTDDSSGKIPVAPGGGDESLSIQAPGGACVMLKSSREYPRGGYTSASTAPAEPIITPQAALKPSSMTAGVVTPGDGKEPHCEEEQDGSTVLISGG